MNRNIETAMSGMSLYLTGGRQKRRLMDEWHAYEAGIILRMDAESGAVSNAAEYISPLEARPDDDASITFKAASIRGNKLYVVTNTEVVIYDVPDFRQTQYVSLPVFNDVHYACPNRAGNVLVVCTGLDMVAEITLQGETVREWAVIGHDPWKRFSRLTDYRKIVTTKPHASHPNFVFETRDDLWVTRNVQQDVISLLDSARRVEFAGRPHDGVQANGKIYFTTVNGFIHILDERTMSMVETIDLNQIGHHDSALGWMRGLLPVGEDLCWVGFTRLRPTKFQDSVSWVRHGFRQYYLPTRVALYDLAKKELLREVDIEPYGLHAVYSILVEPTTICRHLNGTCSEVKIQSAVVAGSVADGSSSTS